ncbi:protein disulfide-isomerase like 2-1-like [Gigantopelta aegis]|uniref:protein disulfide-isomerase like 2-1-like n=1 Tax=Gigantopelta aegis TaxID=1735272 RepID=UPI001B88E768|nr:protein disulfide-isomerase like 2-1-like [Gigantopelta aegis]
MIHITRGEGAILISRENHVLLKAPAHPFLSFPFEFFLLAFFQMKNADKKKLMDSKLKCLFLDAEASTSEPYVDGSKAAFVEFYAPWCGHCKRLAPAYEEVGKTFDNSDDVIIAKVDADADRTLGGRFGVQGSRGRVKKDASNVVDLNPSNFDSIVMDTNKDVLVEFYAPWCGHCKALIPTYEEVATTFKNDENAGVIKELDDLVKKFMQESDSRDAILSETDAKAKTLDNPNAEYYVKVMNKVKEKGDDYIQSESDRLGRMMS